MILCGSDSTIPTTNTTKYLDIDLSLVNAGNFYWHWMHKQTLAVYSYTTSNRKPCEIWQMLVIFTRMDPHLLRTTTNCPIFHIDAELKLIFFYRLRYKFQAGMIFNTCTCEMKNKLTSLFLIVFITILHANLSQSMALHCHPPLVSSLQEWTRFGLSFIIKQTLKAPLSLSVSLQYLL